ncbi:MAG TPA: hypothetical protein VF299_03740 [Mycobacterium sp.]
MAAVTYESSGGAGEWSDDVITEAVNRPCPYCGVQPPENCHGENLTEFTGPMGHIVKLHEPRLRQAPSYQAE